MLSTIRIISCGAWYQKVFPRIWELAKIAHLQDFRESWDGNLYTVNKIYQGHSRAVSFFGDRVAAVAFGPTGTVGKRPPRLCQAHIGEGHEHWHCDCCTFQTLNEIMWQPYFAQKTYKDQVSVCLLHKQAEALLDTFRCNILLANVILLNSAPHQNNLDAHDSCTASCTSSADFGPNKMHSRNFPDALCILQRKNHVNQNTNEWQRRNPNEEHRNIYK